MAVHEAADIISTLRMRHLLLCHAFIEHYYLDSHSNSSFSDNYSLNDSPPVFINVFATKREK